VFSFISDLFFPKDFFDTYLPKEINKQSFVSKIRKPDFLDASFEKILVSSEYSQIEKLLERAKFGAETAIISDFAKIMSANLETQMEQKIIPKPDLLTFVPSDPERLFRRGYHLPEILCQKISFQTKISSLKILEKIQTTKAQTHLNRAERLVNLEKSFAMKKVSLANLKTICLIDDVATTGSTLDECVKTILELNPFLEIFALVLASN